MKAQAIINIFFFVIVIVLALQVQSQNEVIDELNAGKIHEVLRAKKLIVGEAEMMHLKVMNRGGRLGVTVSAPENRGGAGELIVYNGLQKPALVLGTMPQGGGRFVAWDGMDQKNEIGFVRINGNKDGGQISSYELKKTNINKDGQAAYETVFKGADSRPKPVEKTEKKEEEKETPPGKDNQ